MNLECKWSSLIGLSGKMASGKNTFADKLKAELPKDYPIEASGVHQFALADFLRRELNEIMEVLLSEERPSLGRLASELGVEGWQVNTLDRLLREDNYFEWTGDSYTRSKGARGILQFWGTEVRRSQDEDYWVKKCISHYRKLIADGADVVIITDVRFKNEANALRDAGGIILRCEAPDSVRIARMEESRGVRVSPRELGHSSEVDLDDFEFDQVFQTY